MLPTVQHSDSLIEKILPNRRDVRIGLSWRGNNYRIASASWSMEGLFVFRSAFHKGSKTPIMWGYANFKDNKFNLSESTTQAYPNDLHVTLHPPDKTHDGKMHVRATNEEILPENKRHIDWFPVTKPFNLLHFYTPPIDTMPQYSGKLDFLITIPDEIPNSVVVRIDILPPSKMIPLPAATLIANTPHFLAIMSFFASTDRLEATILWPTSPELSLN